MHRNQAFSLIEIIVVIFVVLALLAIMLPSIARQQEVSCRSICAYNLVTLHKAMYTYSVNHQNAFPQYGKAIPGTNDSADKIKGFQVRDRSASPEGFNKLETLQASGELTANGTAALFIIVRDGSVPTKSFICDKDDDAIPDPLTAVYKPGKGYIKGEPAALADVYDSGQPQSLSYSFINMYEKFTGGNWSSNASADWVLMGDDNNASGLRQYFKSPEVGPIQLAQHENSNNHDNSEGQNFLFGDGHVKFDVEIWQGPANDNVMAMGPTREDQAPMKQPLRDNQGQIRRQDRFTDVVLMSITAKNPKDNNRYYDWALASTQKQ